MPHEFGDIVVVDYPFTDGTGSKRRPAVVINKAGHTLIRNGDVLAPVTSRVKPLFGFDVRIEHWREAGLHRESLIKPVFFTLNGDRVESRLGTLQDTDRAKLTKNLRSMLDCAEQRAQQ